MKRDERGACKEEAFMPYGREKAWAVALARDISSDIPAAVQKVRGLNLTPEQVAALRTAFEVRLIRTMGEDSDETPRNAASRNEESEQ
jgi:hypothetical protein